MEEERIERILEKIKLSWSMYPDFRFCQLISSLLQNSQIAHVGDIELETKLDKWLDTWTGKENPNEKWFFETGYNRQIFLVGLGFPICMIEECRFNDDDTLHVVLESGSVFDLDFEDMELKNTLPLKHIVGWLKEESSKETKTSPELAQVIYDLSGYVYREMKTFGADALDTAIIASDFPEAMDVYSTDIVTKPIELIVKHQKFSFSKGKFVNL